MAALTIGDAENRSLVRCVLWKRDQQVTELDRVANEPCVPVRPISYRSTVRMLFLVLQSFR